MLTFLEEECIKEETGFNSFLLGLLTLSISSSSFICKDFLIS